MSEPGVSRCVRVTKKVGWVWKVWVANGPIGSGKNVESSTVVEKPTNHQPPAGARAGETTEAECLPVAGALRIRPGRRRASGVGRARE